MNLYTKYILPKYLNMMMKGADLEKHRIEVVAGVSGVVLEIGFGSGLNLPYYKNINKLYALDPSRGLYDLAQDKIKKFSFPIEYLQASAENIPLNDGSIDFIVSTWTLCSIPHPEVALKEIFRVLRLGGRFAFVEHGKSPRSFIFKIQNLLTPFSKRIAGGCHINRDIEKLIMGAGFKLQKIEKSSRILKPLSFIYRGVGVRK